MNKEELYEVVAKLGVLQAVKLGAFDSQQSSINKDILSWAYGSLFRLNSSVRDVNGAIVSANITWPDGTPGVFTTDVASSTYPGAIDSWHATYISSPVKTITQPLVSRDLNGAVTSQPEITVV
jgi:hypothetical protein